LRFLKKRPIADKSPFPDAISEIEKSPENPNFLVFWNGCRSPEGGPKTQVEDHTKRGGKGQKKRPQNRRFLSSK
jgi:hypothetical protein